MRIYTTVQGIIPIKTLPELWNAQVRYLLTTLRKYSRDLPPCLHCALTRLQYQSDPQGRDTWRTPAEAFQAGGDDCEGLGNILAALLILLHQDDGLPVAMPWLAKFGNGRVIHAVTAVRADVLDQLPELARFAWSKYPLMYPAELSGYVIVDPSWMCGMPFPVRYVHLVKLPEASRRFENGNLYCTEVLSCSLI